jgi:hypothetical protein
MPNAQFTDDRGNIVPVSRGDDRAAAIENELAHARQRRADIMKPVASRDCPPCPPGSVVDRIPSAKHLVLGYAVGVHRAQRVCARPHGRPEAARAVDEGGAGLATSGCRRDSVTVIEVIPCSWFAASRPLKCGNCCRRVARLAPSSRHSGIVAETRSSGRASSSAALGAARDQKPFVPL